MLTRNSIMRLSLKNLAGNLSFTDLLYRYLQENLYQFWVIDPRELKPQMPEVSYKLK